MVGAAGIVASTINNRHQRRESRTSQHGDAASDHNGYACGRHGSKATISEAVGSRSVPPPPSACYGTPGGGTNKEPEVIPEKLTMKEQIKFYVSLTLGIVASICIFALLFLIPLVVEPSISTLLADFDPEAATCVTTDYTYAIGLSKCTAWSSCREGCTSAPSKCHQINVAYRKANKPGYAPVQNFTIVNLQTINVS
ncbi:unnamed protein product [Allacma fusca]|uniref:Protein tipE n=1 Tax=Allacma fusca TaxID=39272 RepID=A0A8J2L6D8_9HEXA|nr:unnamed protein product [Allacma fusca]